MQSLSSLAGIIFSTEALFAAILGIIFLKEPPTLNLWIGVFLIVGSIVSYQTGFPKEGLIGHMIKDKF
ncbi:MAG: EamA family transporter [Anaerovoracaceae bacterium]